MNPYIHKATISTAAGAANSTTLNVKGGLWRQFIVRANTSNLTIFRATVEDENAVILRHYGYHEGDLNDTTMAIPVVGVLTIRISSASAAETFSVRLGVEE